MLSSEQTNFSPTLIPELLATVRDYLTVPEKKVRARKRAFQRELREARRIAGPVFLGLEGWNLEHDHVYGPVILRAVRFQKYYYESKSAFRERIIRL